MKNIFSRSVSQIAFNAPHLTWAVLGYIICYLYFFIYPIFLSSQSMNFPEYVPAMAAIGGDTREMLSIFETRGALEYPTSLYPPLTNLLFILLSSVQKASFYKALTVCNIFVYISTVFILPFLIDKGRKNGSLITLIFITGLFSYGLQFEIERGQWNLISTSLCIFAIWLFHYKDKLQYLSYILFSIAVQLKIYPLIFIVLFVKDWHDWKNNIKRFLIVGAINFGMLFIMGADAFVKFTKALRGEASQPNAWIGNHSIYSFVTRFASETSKLGMEWSDKRLWFMRFAILAVILCCIFTIVLFAYLRKHKGMNAHLLIACAIGAALIPSISHDYKLSIIAAPVAILCTSLPSTNPLNSSLNKRLATIALSLIFFTAYFSTLFSYTNKPEFFGNNFPALFIMSLLATCSYTFLYEPHLETNARASDSRDIAS